MVRWLRARAGLRARALRAAIGSFGVAAFLAGTAVGVVRADGCEIDPGFASVVVAVPELVGTCVAGARTNAATGELEQPVSGGLLVRMGDEGFAAFTDGYRTWVVGPNGLETRGNDERLGWEPPLPTAVPPRASAPAASPPRAPLEPSPPAPAPVSPVRSPGFGGGGLALLALIATIALLAWRNLKARTRFVGELALDELRALEPNAFEAWVASRFVAAGYRARTVGQTGDHGVDVVADGPRGRVVAQAKRYGGTVGEPVVRDLRGAMIPSGAVHGFLVTTGTASAAARSWASGQPITIVDSRDVVGWFPPPTRGEIRRPGAPATVWDVVVAIATAMWTVARWGFMAAVAVAILFGRVRRRRRRW